MSPNKIYEGRSTIRMFNADCMDFLNECEEDQYELAIVDPPYGINLANNSFRQKHEKKDWDIQVPNEIYFNEIFRVCDNQIIWGGNYFDLTPSQGFVVWDKMQPQDFSSAMCELAWMSFQKPAKVFKKWVVNADKHKIHPTQKPVQLYRWLLQNYATEGDTILDTHGGSMSIAIACWEEGFDLDIIELDEDYFNDAVNRFENHIKQGNLFSV